MLSLKFQEYTIKVMDETNTHRKIKDLKERKIITVYKDEETYRPLKITYDLLHL